MKKIAFIGAYDKTDFLLYIAKILTAFEKKVLIIDATILQKAKYIVPVINPTTTYVTEYEGIDVAVGFQYYEDIQDYLGVQSEETLEYDIVLMDIDSYEGYKEFGIQQAEKKYFVTAFDLYSLKRGLEALSGITEKIQLTKVLFSRDMLKEEDEYLEFLAMGLPIEWNNMKVYFPFDRGDQSTIIENQRTARIKFKNLSTQYKDSIMYLTEDILEGENITSNDIRKTVRKIEKGA